MEKSLLYTIKNYLSKWFNLPEKEEKEKQKTKDQNKIITLRYFILAIIASATVANSIIIIFSSDAHNKHSITLLILNITAAIASSLGIIAVYRHGVYGIHGKSYLFLTLGIISWFSADLTLAYYYFALGIEQQILFVSVADVLWFVGYAFLALHLFKYFVLL